MSDFKHRDYGEPAVIYPYTDTFVVCRYEAKDGKKIFPWSKPNGHWESKSVPAPRPLYGDWLAKSLIIVEGEKCVEHLKKLGIERTPITWPGGAQAWKHADWNALEFADVLLFPDHDEVGYKCMRDIAEHLTPIVAKVQIVDHSTLDLPKGWDIADTDWNAKQFEEWVKARTNPDPFVFHTASDESFKAIPPRPFIYRRHYMRGMVSVTAAAGGSGKSSIVLVEMISIALGVDLLADRAELATGPQNVWYHNGEDPEDEIRRRIAAICKHYAIEPAELANRLYWTVGRDCPLIVAREMPAGVISEPKTVAEVIACMKAKAIAVLAVDPFISTHRVSENSNDAMEVVMSQYREISEQAQAAIEAVHHFRKSNGTEASVDDIRGASAMIGAARSARILCAMSKEEAQKAGVDPAERRRFIWEGQAKANMYVASDRRTWREMVSIDLENAADPYESDKVGVATHWEFPNSIGTLTDELFATAIGSIRACKDPLRRRVSMLSNGWVGKLICEALDVDAASPTVRAQVGGQIKSWIERGLLIVDRMHSQRQGREVDFVSVVDRD